jgi:uncharacterized protein YndB with AHSA1/START domain
MYPLTVVRQSVVQASWEDCWRCLITPAIVSEWFAATDRIGLDERVVFDFGDGDFFAGRVTACEPPSSLRLSWRFWDIGPSYDIAYALSPLADATEVSVIDRGADGPEEVDSLREGWEDFLTRLKIRAETGAACRYRWSESLGGTCFADESPELRARLADPAWWRRLFPGAGVTVRADSRGYRLEFSEPEWNGVVTTAHVRFALHLGRPCLRVSHHGWTQLPHETQIAIRRRYAGWWREVLAAAETEFGRRDLPQYAVDTNP